MRTILMGVIADDFTGASDAASFLMKSGYRTVLLTELPDAVTFDCDCVVIAQKIRSIEPKAAVEQARHAYDFLKSIPVQHIYFKYCSTFDSTPRGNIGVILDALMEWSGQTHCILCPSLPVNGRTVEDGILSVNGVPLAESPMKDHPLNPMWDSYIPNLMKDQSQYPCHILRRKDMQEGRTAALLKQWEKEAKRFYVIPDYADDTDGALVGRLFANDQLASGGSGLLEHVLPRRDADSMMHEGSEAHHKAILVCGSCSKMSKRQIEAFDKTGYATYEVCAQDVLDGKQTTEMIFATVQKRQPCPTLVYSDGVNGHLDHEAENFDERAKAMEQLLSELCVMAKEAGYKRIIVAGGETGGAVTLRLGYKAFAIGTIVAPGVPTLIPLDQPDLRLILKSGNFGQEDFFERTLTI